MQLTINVRFLPSDNPETFTLKSGRSVLERLDSEAVRRDQLRWIIEDFGEANFNPDINYIEAVMTSKVNLDWEILEAAHECGIEIHNVKSHYQGCFENDEVFARSIADSMGIEIASKWPFSHINWHSAAKELMLDYATANNHYFLDNENTNK